MAKIKLGNKPKVFKSINAKFVMPDGEEGIVPVVFKYRTQKEYGIYLNSLYKESDEPKPEADQINFELLFGKNVGKAAEMLIEAIDSWGLDEELSFATMEALADELPAAIVSLHSAYRLACVEGRLGN